MFITHRPRRSAVELSARWRDRLHIARTVAPAVAIAFVIDILLTRTSFPGFFGLLSVYLVLFLFRPSLAACRCCLLLTRIQTQQRFSC